MKRFRTHLGLLLPILGLPILLAHIYLERYYLPRGDDYDFASGAKNHGIFGNVIYGYQTWEGRFSSYFLNSLIGSSGLFPYHTNAVMLVSMALFVIALALVLWRLEGKYSYLLWFDMAFIVLAMPDQIKKNAFYGMDANIEYVLPVTLTFFVLVFLNKMIRKRFEKPALLSLGFMFILIAGFNPLIAMTLIIGICGYWLSLYPQQVPQSSRLKAIFLGTMIGFAIEVIAPGNFLRLYIDTGGDLPGIFFIATRTLDELGADLPFFGTCFVYALLRAYGTGTSAASFGICKTGKAACWYGISVLTVVFATYYIVIYGYDGNHPSGRTLMLAYIVTYIAALDMSQWLARTYPLSRYAFFRYPLCRYATFSSLLVSISYLPTQGFSHLILNLENGPKMQSIGLAQIDNAYRAQAEKSAAKLIVPEIPYYIGTFFGGVAPHHDENNQAFAKYFGLTDIEFQ